MKPPTKERGFRWPPWQVRPARLFEAHWSLKSFKSFRSFLFVQGKTGIAL